MLKLCGFAASNYHNKVKLALMEKGIPFEEVLVWAGPENPSPLNKVPYLETEDGMLCESDVILEYLEDRFPEKSLLPASAFARAKVREINTFLNLHVELVARELYRQAFFGGTITDQTKTSVEKRLRKSLAAFFKLAKFSPYVVGDMFTIADCSAIVHLPLVSLATKIIYGEDFLDGTPAKDYVKQMNAMPSMQKINADRKANTELMVSRRAAN